MIECNNIYNLDCLEGLRKLESGTVDMVLCDPPYGTTQCFWDKPLDWVALWTEIKRVVKPSGAILLFSAQPFTTDLINSNRKMFRYEIIWEKTQKTGFLNAKKMPMRAHENILVFYQKQPTYNPQKYSIHRKDVGRLRKNGTGTSQYNEYRNDNWRYEETGERYPTDVVHFSNWNGTLFGKTESATKHPTQKPVNLLEYFIQTFSNEGDTVCDFCGGSGSTAVACHNTKRNYILFEKDDAIFKDSIERITCETAQTRLF